MASCTPISESWPSSEIMPAVSRITWLSVISSSSSVGSIPVSDSTRVTMSRKPRSANWRADRLIAMRRRGSPRSSHSRAWRQPSRSTHSPSSLIRPVSSASGMKSPGMTRPRLGLPAHQRLHGDDLAALEVHLRLVVQHEILFHHRAAQRRLERHAALHRHVHLRGEVLVGVLAQALAVEHGGVGALHERLRIAAVVRDTARCPRSRSRAARCRRG